MLLTIICFICFILIKIIYKWNQRINKIKSKPNIVVLGLSRTGTSSICEALKILGNEVWHFTKFKPKTMKKIGYNAIGDLPYFRRNFTVSDIEPNTKYILTTRSSILWKESMKKWIDEIWNIDIDNPHIKPPFINKYYTIGDNIFKKTPVNCFHNFFHNITQEYPEIYTGNLKNVIKNHEERIISLFNTSGNRDKLLVIDITDKSINSSEKWKKLCQFLNVEKIPQYSIPEESYENLYVKQINRVL